MLIHPNPVHNLASYILKTHFNITFLSTLKQLVKSCRRTCQALCDNSQNTNFDGKTQPVQVSNVRTLHGITRSTHNILKVFISSELSYCGPICFLLSYFLLNFPTNT